METSLIIAVTLLAAGWVAMELRLSSAIVEILAGILLAWFITDLAELESIDPAVVAFAVGIALGGVMQANKQVKHKLKGLVFGLFAPVFFLQAGTQIDLRHLSVDLIFPAVLLLVLAVGLKYLGTVMAVRRRVPRQSRRREMFANLPHVPLPASRQAGKTADRHPGCS